jgi:predicted MPP superfamily phosphohydrolase
MDTLFRWIHLSDIHTGHGDTTNVWDQRLVLEEIVKDIALQRKSQPEHPFDVVLVTGDIANTGAGRLASEYADAAIWLRRVGDAAGVAPAQIFVVPGNHDVDRGADRDAAVKQLVTDLREGRVSLDDALTQPGQRAMLAHRMERYLEFAGAFAPVGADADARLHWVHRLVAQSGLRVRLVGLNTTLLAAGDDDQGKLRVGLKQIGQAFADIQEGELVLALGHHPLGGGWLADQATIEPWLKRHTHALLTGHVHVADAEESRSGAGSSFLRVVAGSAHGDKMPPGIPAGHGYSFGAVVRDERGKVHIWITPRKWSEKNASFRPDVDNVPDSQSYSDHPLALSLALPAAAPTPATAKQQARPPAVTVAPGEPVKVFISSAPEDDGLRIELQKHLTMVRRSKLGAFKHSQEVPPGVDRAEWIAARLDEAQMILLLISRDYIASDDYYEEQLLRAVERHDRGEAKVIPILLRPFKFSDEPFAGLERLPNLFDPSSTDPHNNGYSVDSYPGGRDKAFESIVADLRSAMLVMRGEAKDGSAW